MSFQLFLCQRNGNINQAEADEWQRRMVTRQRFLTLPDEPFHAS